MSNIVLQAENIVKKYENTPDAKEILQGINLEVEEGQFLCILGTSGCGKTTFLRCVGGFENYEGTIRINGEVVTTPNIERMMVFQDFNQLFPWKTVEKNVEYPLKMNGIRDKEELKRRSGRALELVELLSYKDFYPHQLSGGMKQRVAIAKALALRPKIILMDEPFASLDAMTRRNLQSELARIQKKENITVMFVTHNIQEALVLGDRMIVFSRDGQIKLDVKNNLEKPVTPASPGYGDLWKLFSKALEEENTKKQEEV